jgi:hypothetical protein
MADAPNSGNAKAFAKTQKKRTIVYIGEDGGYWQTIQDGLTTNYSFINFEFQTLFDKDSEAAQRLMINLLDIMPGIIYIDFSTSRDTHLSLAQLVTREIAFGNVPVVGLVEEKEYVRDCLSAGVDFIHVKCGEHHDVVFDPMLMAYPKDVKRPQFARAKFKRDVFLIDDFRIGYITPTSIHVEGNIKLEKGEIVEIESAIPVKNVPSKKFKVRDISDTNLYYDYRYAYDLDFIFVDEPELREDEFEDALGETDERRRAKLVQEAKNRRQERVNEYQESLKFSRRKHREWVLSSVDERGAKKTKVFIVDKSLRIFRQEGVKPLDRYPYGIRCQTALSSSQREIQSFWPNIIGIQMFGQYVGESLALFQDVAEGLIAKTEEIPTEEILGKDPRMEMLKSIPVIEKADFATIETIVNYVKAVENYTPFIVIFNCPFKSSKELQETFQYPMLLVHKESLTMDAVLNVASLFEKKQEEKLLAKVKAKVAELKKRDPAKYRNLTPDDFNEKRYFIKKSSPLSHCSYRYPVTLETITESELTFLSKEMVELKTFRMDFPVEMSINAIPSDGKAFQDVDGLKQYKALIHSIGEDDKKTLRRFVNEVIFEPKMEQREKEEKAYWDLHSKRLQEKMDTPGSPPPKPDKKDSQS